MKCLRMVSLVAVILAFLVVTLGAFTRLTDAGLGCPDWPGCYGKLVLPSTSSGLTVAQQQFPHSPIESRKAWTEMIHRYAAGTLGLLIAFIAMYVFYKRDLCKHNDTMIRHNRAIFPWKLPLVLVLLVLFQALLGMWTVTLKLLPVVVMGHLLGGILIFSCLCYLCWQFSGISSVTLPRFSGWITLGLVIVFCQIALGGWVSSNYAGIACIGFPQCNGHWLPTLHFAKAFHFFSTVGANYQGGLLDNETRVTIQMIHRLGALVTVGYVLILAGLLLRWAPSSAKSIRVTAIGLCLLVLFQFGLGVVNVVYLLPLWAAVLHNGMAALLLAGMVSLRYLTTQGAIDASRI